MERIDVAKFAFGPDRRLCEWSAVAETLTGWSAADLIGRPATEVMPLLLADTTLDAIVSTFGEQRPSIFILDMRRKEGRIRQAVFQFMGEGRPGFDGGFSAYFTDITEIQRATNRLFDSGRLFRSLFENIEDGFALVELLFDDTGRAVDAIVWQVNSAFERLTGLKPQNVIGVRVSTYMPDVSQEILDAEAEVIRTGKSRHVEKRQPDTGQWLDMLVFPFEANIVSEVFRDITESKRLTAVLAESEARHAFLLRLSDALRVLSDPAEIQAAAARVLGEAIHADRVFYASVVERNGKPHFHIERIYHVPEAPMLPVETAADPGNRFAADFEAGHTLAVDDVAADPRMLPDETRLYQERLINAWVSVPLVKGSRVVACLVVQQCTPRHWTPEDIIRIEETAERTWAAVERARSAEALAAADRNKSRFLNILSHELRNPLATIVMSLSLLDLSPDADKQIKYAVNVLKRQTDHLTRIVDDLLDVSRIANGKVQILKRPLDIIELLRRCVADFMPQFRERDIKLLPMLPDKPIMVQGDAVRLTQVFGNLLQNALKFTPGHGTVTLEATVDPAAGDACVTVSDTGIGIEPNVLPHVFEPFAQADQSLSRSQGGLGLGLSIVRGIIESHGGKAYVFSEGLDKGSCFEIHLPIEK